MNVKNFLTNYKLKFNRTTPYKMNITNSNKKTFRINIRNKNTNKLAATLKFDVTPELMYIKGGMTHVNYRKRGLGELLRALATKSGHVAGSTEGYQYGSFENETPVPGKLPGSSKIMRRLGWNVNNTTFDAKFIYGKNNIRKVNSFINMYLGRQLL